MFKRLVKRALMVLQVLRKRDTAPKVVFYHDVGTKHTSMGTPSDLFWSHMSYLAQVNTPNLQAPLSSVALAKEDQTSNLQPHGHAVAFDDGFRGVWDEREKFRAMDIHPTVFIAIRLVGQPGYLTWDEIRTLQNDYGFNFQCHTWSHQTLVGPVNTDLPVPADANFRDDAWYRHELVDSKAELERQLGRDVSALCFPVGNFNDDVIRRCAAAGYSALYASFPGNMDDAPSILPPLSSVALREGGSTKLIPRNLVQEFSLFDFKLTLSGGLNGLCDRYRRMHYVEDVQ